MDNGVKRRRNYEEDFRTPSKRKKTSEEDNKMINLLLFGSCSKKRTRNCEEQDTPSKKMKTGGGDKVMSELFDEGPDWCLACASTPCLCILTKVEMKIEMLSKVDDPL